MSRAQGQLFERPLPNGFLYRDDFIGLDEETALVDAIGRVEFANYEMRGVVARRRVAFFGMSYDASVTVAPNLPAFLLPLRERVAAWAQVDPAAFAMALINEYQSGAPIGWHRDAPQYEIVAGVSLLSACRMKLRPYVSPSAVTSPGPTSPGPTSGRQTSHGRRLATHEITLQPRSAYLMTGEARSAYEHHIPAVEALRYSITFRTLR